MSSLLIRDKSENSHRHYKSEDDIKRLCREECLQRGSIFFIENLFDSRFKSDTYECYREEYSLEVFRKRFIFYHIAVNLYASIEPDAEHSRR